MSRVIFGPGWPAAVAAIYLANTDAGTELGRVLSAMGLYFFDPANVASFVANECAPHTATIFGNNVYTFHHHPFNLFITLYHNAATNQLYFMSVT